MNSNFLKLIWLIWITNWHFFKTIIEATYSITASLYFLIEMIVDMLVLEMRWSSVLFQIFPSWIRLDILIAISGLLKGSLIVIISVIICHRFRITAVDSSYILRTIQTVFKITHIFRLFPIFSCKVFLIIAITILHTVRNRLSIIHMNIIAVLNWASCHHAVISLVSLIGYYFILKLIWV